MTAHRSASTWGGYTMTDRVAKPSDSIYLLLRRLELRGVLRDGVRSLDEGGPDVLGAPEYLTRRSSIEIPPPFRGPVSSYTPMRFTPLTPSTLSVLTGYRGAEQMAPADLVFLVSKPEWLARLHRPFLFTNLGLASGQAQFFSDLSRLDVIDVDRLASGQFDTRHNRLAPHVAEAEFLVWGALPPRGILEIICSHDCCMAGIEAEIAVAGRGGRIAVRSDPRCFFGRT